MCRGPVCAGQRHADGIHARLAERVAARELGAVVTLDRQSCFGRCFFGPNVHVRERLPASPAHAIEPGSVPARLSALYSGVHADDADEILAAHVLGGRVIERLVRRIPAPAPVDLPSGSQPDVRLATALPRLETVPAATPDAGPETVPEAIFGATPEPHKDPEPSADVAPDPR